MANVCFNISLGAIKWSFHPSVSTEAQMTCSIPPKCKVPKCPFHEYDNEGKCWRHNRQS